MATFIIKTFNDRNLFIEADNFQLESRDRVYKFYKSPETLPGLGKIVAIVPVSDVFAVLHEDAFEGDFYDRQDFEEPDEFIPPTVEQDKL